MTSGVSPSNAKIDRNQAIYKDRLSGMPLQDLSAKYNLSETRIHLIIKDYKAKLLLAEVRMGD